MICNRCGYKLEAPRAYTFKNNTDRFGWTEGVNNTHHYGLYVTNGRILDTPNLQLKTGLREIAKVNTIYTHTHISQARSSLAKPIRHGAEWASKRFFLLE